MMPLRGACLFPLPSFVRLRTQWVMLPTTPQGHLGAPPMPFGKGDGGSPIRCSAIRAQHRTLMYSFLLFGTASRICSSSSSKMSFEVASPNMSTPVALLGRIPSIILPPLQWRSPHSAGLLFRMRQVKETVEVRKRPNRDRPFRLRTLSLRLLFLRREREPLARSWSQ